MEPRRHSSRPMRAAFGAGAALVPGPSEISPSLARVHSALFGASRLARSVLLGTLLLVLASAAAHAQFLQLPSRDVAPSEVSPAFADLNGEFPVAAQAYECGKPTEDDFFLRAAKLHGIFSIADHLTSKLGEALATAANGAFEVPQADPSKWPDLIDALAGQGNGVDPAALELLKARGRQIGRLSAQLTTVSANVATLSSEATTLTANAHRDFRGLEMLTKLPKLLNSLRRVATQTTADGMQASKTIGYMTPIAEAFARNFGAGFQFGSDTSASGGNVNSNPSGNFVASGQTAPDAGPSQDGQQSVYMGPGQSGQANPTTDPSQSGQPDALPAGDGTTPDRGAYPKFGCPEIQGHAGQTLNVRIRVTDPSGQGLSGVPVELSVRDAAGTNIVGSGTTEPDGFVTIPYTINWVFTGRATSVRLNYWAATQGTESVAPGRGTGIILALRGSSTADSNGIAVGASPKFSCPELRGAEGQTIDVHLRVTDPAGHPLSGVPIELTIRDAAGTNIIGSGTSDQGGDVSIPYTINAQFSGRATSIRLMYWASTIGNQECAPGRASGNIVATR